jgi:bifunctional pyridoxal-dependent enzyme with beta-cystathionase and maltose regulon repressor activities
MRPCRRHDQGAALGIVLLLMTVLFILGGAFVEVSNTEIRQTQRVLSAEQLRYAAEAGVTYAQSAYKTWVLPKDIDLDDPRDQEMFGAVVRVHLEAGSADSVLITSTAHPPSGPDRTITVELRNGAVVRWNE